MGFSLSQTFSREAPVGDAQVDPQELMKAKAVPGAPWCEGVNGIFVGLAI